MSDISRGETQKLSHNDIIPLNEVSSLIDILSSCDEKSTDISQSTVHPLDFDRNDSSTDTKDIHTSLVQSMIDVLQKCRIESPKKMTYKIHTSNEIVTLQIPMGHAVCIRHEDVLAHHEYDSSDENDNEMLTNTSKGNNRQSSKITKNIDMNTLSQPQLQLFPDGRNESIVYSSPSRVNEDHSNHTFLECHHEDRSLPKSLWRRRSSKKKNRVSPRTRGLLTPLLT